MTADNKTGKRKGRHPDKALSATFVRNAKGPGFYADGNGLYLKVDKSGARRWVQRLRIRGARKDIAIGPVALVTLADAREIAVGNRKVARAGGDPIQEAKRIADIPTFEEAAHKVHAIHLPSWRNKKHGDQFINTLKTYAFPTMEKISVSEVDTSHVMSVLLPIWLEKPETARRVRQRIGVIMKWAIAQGWRADNPAEAVVSALPKQDASKSHRKALPYDQVSDCIATVRATNASQSTKMAFEFLILTASRSGEVRNAVWEEVDLDAKVWTVPAGRMKAKVEHRVPLSCRCVEILTEARTLFGSEGLIFPGTRHGRALSDATLLKLLNENGFDAHIHGFRAGFRTWTQEKTNVQREVAEQALAHTIKSAAEASYARSNLFEKRRDLMERWAAYLDPDKPTVVSLREVTG